jgi:hypothetical protein
VEYSIEIISSSDVPHKVLIYHDEDKISVLCTCQAGEWGKLCSHKTGVLAGDTSILHNSSDITLLAEISSLIKTTNYQILISEYNLIKKDIEILQKHEKNMRKRLEITLKSGLRINGNES